MLTVLRSWLVSGAVLIASLIPAMADYSCAFTVRSTVDEITGLNNHTYRVSKNGDGYQLLQRFSGGKWQSLGMSTPQFTPEFAVFLHLPDQVNSTVTLLTIHRSGSSSLVMHYPAFGNSSQYQKAWLLHGECLTAAVK